MKENGVKIKLFLDLNINYLSKINPNKNLTDASIGEGGKAEEDKSEFHGC